MFNKKDTTPDAAPVRALTAGYIIALAIIAYMSLVIHYGIGEIIKEQNNRDLVFASRQLKLIPMISLNVTEYVSSKNNIIKGRVENDISSLEQAYKELFKNDEISKGQTSETFYSIQVQESHKRAKTQIEAYVTAVKALIALPRSQVNENNQYYQEIKTLIQGSLIQNMDSINIAYEAESLQYVGRLQVYQYGALIVIMVTLLLEALLIFMPLVRRVSTYADKLESLARTDALTNIDNRRSILEKGVKEIGRSKRYDKAFSVSILDIDHFKTINDTYGHEAGDLILKTIVDIFKENIRLEDELGRYGGEEFIFLLPETSSAEAATIVMNRIRRAVELKDFRLDSGEYIKVTVSAGIAEVDLELDKSLDPAIRRADVVLYKAKEEGRNQVKVFK